MQRVRSTGVGRQRGRRAKRQDGRGLRSEKSSNSKRQEVRKGGRSVKAGGRSRLEVSKGGRSVMSGGQ